MWKIWFYILRFLKITTPQTFDFINLNIIFPDKYLKLNLNKYWYIFNNSKLLVKNIPTTGERNSCFSFISYNNQLLLKYLIKQCR